MGKKILHTMCRRPEGAEEGSTPPISTLRFLRGKSSDWALLLCSHIYIVDWISDSNDTFINKFNWIYLFIYFNMISN